MTSLDDIMAVIEGDSEGCVVCGDCLEVMVGMEANSVDLIATDPPYYRVKNEAWDRQWDTREGFLAWVGQLCEQWQRILKPNGSLYCFASPQMRAYVEVEVGKRFNCLPTITRIKEAGWHQKAAEESLRSYFPQTEGIIFAEHYGADNMAKGEAGYAVKCDELRGFVFEPLRAYLAGEFNRSGLSRREVDECFGTANVSQYWLQRRGFIIPTADKYAGLQHLRPACFCREYEDLRREYEDLRREYEDLRRPFSVTADVPYTDVWTFPTVQSYPGKHPCEKPLAMMEHIVKASSRPGAVVLDCCAGSGATLEAAKKLGRRYIGIDTNPEYVNTAKARLRGAPRPLFGAGESE